MSDSPTYSVRFRLQRTTTEVASISVPWTEDLTLRRADGSQGIDVEKVVRRAIQLGQSPDVDWQQEQSKIELHPIQPPPSEGHDENA